MPPQAAIPGFVHSAGDLNRKLPPARYTVPVTDLVTVFQGGILDDYGLGVLTIQNIGTVALKVLATEDPQGDDASAALFDQIIPAGTAAEDGLGGFFRYDGRHKIGKITVFNPSGVTAGDIVVAKYVLTQDWRFSA